MSSQSRTGGRSATSAEFTHVVHEVARGSRTSIIYGLLGHVVRIALQVLMGRVLGAHAYGLYTLGRSVLEVATRLGSMGMQNAVVRFLAIFRGEGDEAQIRGTILASLALVLVASSALGVGLWLVAEWLAVTVFHEPALGPVLRVFAVALPLHAMLVLLAACARGFRHMAYFSGMTHMLHPLGVLLLSSIAFLIGLRLEGALLGFTCATGLAALLMLYGLVRLFPTLWALRQGVTFNGKDVVPYAAKMFLADFTHPLLGHTDRLMLGYFSIARDVGIYSISAFIGSKLSFFQIMFNSIFAPVIADLHNRGKHDELVRLFQTVSKWTLLCTLPIFFACLFLGDFVLSLFGRDFQAGWPVLVVLASAHLIDIGVGPAGYMLLMTGRPGLALLNSWLSGVVNILLNLWLIPRHGMLGAALATGITLALLNIVRLIQVRYLYHCYPFRLGTLKTLIAGAIAGGAVWKLSQMNQLEDWGKLAMMGGGLLLYAGLLTLFGWDDEDQLVIHRLRRNVLPFRP